MKQKDKDSRNKRVLVGVYGSLRKGFGNSHILFGSKHVDTVKTKDKFLMFDVGRFPMVFKPEEKGVGSPLLVEIYEVDGDTLATLDILEGVPNLYDRYPITNIKGYEGVPVFMYITNPDIYPKVLEQQCRLIKSGDWFKARPDLRNLVSMEEERMKRTKRKTQ